MSDGPQPESPSQPPRPNPWPLIGLLSGIGFLGSVGVLGWRLVEQLRQLRTQQATLEQRRAVTEQQLTAVKQQHEALSQTYQQLLGDRDNLLAQLKRLMEEQSQVATDRDLFEGVLKRVSQEDYLLKDRLTSLQADHEQLQELADRLLKERDDLQSQLAKTKGRVEEKRLREELAKEKDRHRQDTQALSEAQRQLKTLNTRQTKADKELATTHNRFSTLQEKYGTLLAQDRVLQIRVNRMPKDVTSIAREHERLLKEVADTHYNMGVLFTKKDDYTRAVKEFQKVVELRPDDADAHYNLGVIYAEHLPNRDRALTYFRRYLQLNPSAKDASWVKQYIASWQAWEGKERLE